MNYLLVAVVAAIFGSFVNMLIYRLNQGVSLVKPVNSVCPKCQHVLGFFDLIPIFSYLFLRGRCRYCGVNIAKRYLLVELSFVLVALLSLSLQLSIITALILLTLVAILFSDLEYMQIPYTFNVVLAALVFSQVQFSAIDLRNFLFLALLVLTIKLLERFHYKRESFGGADILLYLIFAFAFTWPNFFLMVLSSFLVAALLITPLLLSGKISTKDHVPFAPFILLAYVIVRFAGDIVLVWYWGLFGV